MVFQPSDHIRTILKNLPMKPGCYLMKDDRGKIIYVGKAKLLRNRVRSYFSAQAELNLSGLTIRNGSGSWFSGLDYDDSAGGAILNWGKLTVSGCNLSDNYASFGAGIYNLGTATVTDSILTDNVVIGSDSWDRSAGGGIFNADRATLLLTGSVFTGNQALGGSDNTSTGGGGFVGTAAGGGLQNSGEATVTSASSSAGRLMRHPRCSVRRASRSAARGRRTGRRAGF